MKLQQLQEARTLGHSTHIMGYIQELINELEHNPSSDQATDFHVDSKEKKELRAFLSSNYKTYWENRSRYGGARYEDNHPWWYIPGGEGDWIITFRGDKVELFSERWKDYWDFNTY